MLHTSDVGIINYVVTHTAVIGSMSCKFASWDHRHRVFSEIFQYRTGILSFLEMLSVSRSSNYQLYLSFTGCQEGRFGEYCQSVKDCLNGGILDPVTGRCQCPMGWMGNMCDQGGLSILILLSIIPQIPGNK